MNTNKQEVSANTTSATAFPNVEKLTALINANDNMRCGFLIMSAAVRMLNRGGNKE